MANEKYRVLEMLENGKITADEALQLIECLEQTQNEEGKPAKKPLVKGSSRKLRVDVVGDAKEAKNMDVHVMIPMALARVADNIIANCVPKAAHEELKAQGIDLSQLCIGDMVDTLETLEEDIVNADIHQEGVDLKVRVYVD